MTAEKHLILSPDPLLTTVCPYVADLKLEEGQDVESAVSEVLKMKQIFGVDLYEAGLAELVCGYLKEMTKAPGAVRETLKKIRVGGSGMKAFMDQDFLLETETAKMLYHEYAAKMPVLDYHCHISPQEIAEDRQFENITQVWLGGDHYKWRQMRQTVWMSTISQVMRLHGKNFKNGRKRWKKLWETRCSTGVIWN